MLFAVSRDICVRGLVERNLPGYVHNDQWIQLWFALPADDALYVFVMFMGRSPHD